MAADCGSAQEGCVQSPGVSREKHNFHASNSKLAAMCTGSCDGAGGHSLHGDGTTAPGMCTKVKPFRLNTVADLVITAVRDSTTVELTEVHVHYWMDLAPALFADERAVLGKCFQGITILHRENA